MSKLDRFDRIAKKLAGNKSGLLWQEGAMLLRNEHRVVRRMVSSKRAVLHDPLSDWGIGYVHACVDILAALDKRRR
jgi:hypothetical protein